MTNKHKRLLILISIFVFIQCAFNIIAFLIDVYDWCKSDLAESIKYSSIVLCFIVSILAYKTKKGFLITAGLGFTLISDYFLLIRFDHFVLGVSIFILAHTCYFLFIEPKHWKLSLIIRGAIFLVVTILVSVLIEEKDASLYLAAFYFINLVMNTVDSYVSKDKGLLLFAIGLTFFIGCDIFVCFYNLNDYIDTSSEFIKKLIDFSYKGIWLCYIPSQTLISISAYFKDKYDKVGENNIVKQCEE